MKNSTLTLKLAEAGQLIVDVSRRVNPPLFRIVGDTEISRVVGSAIAEKNSLSESSLVEVTRACQRLNPNALRQINHDLATLGRLTITNILDRFGLKPQNR